MHLFTVIAFRGGTSSTKVRTIHTVGVAPEFVLPPLTFGVIILVFVVVVVVVVVFRLVLWFFDGGFNCCGTINDAIAFGTGINRAKLVARIAAEVWATSPATGTSTVAIDFWRWKIATPTRKTCIHSTFQIRAISGNKKLYEI